MPNWKDDLTYIPLNGKVPAVEFKDVQKGESIGPAEGQNIGILTGARSGIFVVDCDSEDAALQYLGLYSTEADTFTIQTARGYHFYYQLQDLIVRNSASKLLPHVDIRGEGGQVCAFAPDRHVVNDVEPLPASEALLAWLRAEAPAEDRPVYAPTAIDFSDGGFQKRYQKGLRYCRETAAPAISGQGGHLATFNVARYLCGLNLPEAVCLDLMQKFYNPRCQPSWTHAELAHKIEDAKGSPMVIAPDDFGAKLIGRLKDGNAPVISACRAIKLISRPRADDIRQLLTSHPDWDNVFRFNLLSRVHVAIKPPFPMRMQNGLLSEGDIGKIQAWLECPPGQNVDDETVGYVVSSSIIRTVVLSIAESRPFNPVVEYLDILAADTRTHDCVSNEIAQHLHTIDDAATVNALFLKHMVAAVRRARAMPGIGQPMAPVDYQTILVLHGDQDYGKTRLIKILAKQREFYQSVKGDMKDSEILVKLRSAWLGELEEMSIARKADRDSLKAFISADADFERAKYERGAEQVQRGYVLFGTTNELDMNDPTGMRRFAVIRVGQIDHAWFEEHVDDLWGEANVLALDATFSHHQSDGEKEWVRQRNAISYEIDDPLASKLAEMLVGVPFVTMNEAYRVVMRDQAEPVVPIGQYKAYTDAFKRLGCERHAVRGKGKGWKLPQKIASGTVRADTTRWLKGSDDWAEEVRQAMTKN